MKPLPHFVRAFILLAIIAVTAGCSKNTETYATDVFSVQYPEDWELSMTDDGKVMLVKQSSVGLDRLLVWIDQDFKCGSEELTTELNARVTSLIEDPSNVTMEAVESVKFRGYDAASVSVLADDVTTGLSLFRYKFTLVAVDSRCVLIMAYWPNGIDEVAPKDFRELENVISSIRFGNTP